MQTLISRMGGHPVRTVALAAALVASALSVLPGAAQSPAGSPQPTGPTKVVGSVAELESTLRAAHPGDTIALKPGSYAGVALSNFNFPQPVVITSVDPSRPAVLLGPKFGRITGLTLRQVNFSSEGVKDPYYAFRFGDCQNIILDRVDAYGDTTTVPGLQVSGFFLRSCKNVSFLNSHIHDINAAITAGDVDNLIIDRNLFDRVSKGGLELGGDSFVTITDNVFTNFIVDQGVHPDAIQIFTAGTKKPVHDISISGNLFYRGKGHAIQGIYVQDEVGSLPFEHVSIVNNAIIGTAWHAIVLRGASGEVAIKDNVVATWPGIDLENGGDAKARLTAPTVKDFYAWILVAGDLKRAKVTETGNSAQAFADNSTSREGAPLVGNRVLGRVADHGKALIQAWAARNGREVPPDL